MMYAIWTHSYSKREARRPSSRQNQRRIPSNRGNQGNSKTDEQSLEKLLKDVKKRVKRSKGLWDALPKMVCRAMARDYSSKLCWNGTAAMKPDSKMSIPVNDRDMMVPQRGPPNLLVAEQVLILQLITDKLRASYNGLDVKWVEELGKYLFETRNESSQQFIASNDTDFFFQFSFFSIHKFCSLSSPKGLACYYGPNFFTVKIPSLVSF